MRCSEIPVVLHPGFLDERPLIVGWHIFFPSDVAVELRGSDHTTGPDANNSGDRHGPAALVGDWACV